VQEAGKDTGRRQDRVQAWNPYVWRPTDAGHPKSWKLISPPKHLSGVSFTTCHIRKAISAPYQGRDLAYTCSFGSHLSHHGSLMPFIRLCLSVAEAIESRFNPVLDNVCLHSCWYDTILGNNCQGPSTKALVCRGRFQLECRGRLSCILLRNLSTPYQPWNYHLR
jgi:hypothetical protein